MCQSRKLAWAIIFCICATSFGQDTPQPLSLAAQFNLRQARQLLEQNDPANAVILLDAQLASCQGNADYLQVTADAYRRQFDRLQREGKLAQATQLWEKLLVIQPDAAKAKSPASITVRQTPASSVPVGTPPASTTATNPIHEAESAFKQGQYAQACQCFEKVQAQGTSLPQDVKERYAYCKLYQVAERLNALQGKPGEQRPQMEHEVRAALELAPRLEFGKELLQRLQLQPSKITTAIKHLDQKDQGWLVCETANFKIYHTDRQLAEQVAQIAETTRAAVIRKWLGHEVTWQQLCQIYVHPTADSYHRQSGMPATAPGHSDYDADKNDASNIHYRRVFVRADHAHMLSAILPHEVTHVILNGQFGRKLLPRWADEGMAVLSEPYGRIQMHLTPLASAYQQGQALSLQELLTVEDYPKDRSKVASFYGQSVCLVEYLCTLKGPQGFVNFMRDANREGDAAALQRNYGLSLAEVEARLQQWIVSEQMPTLMRTASVR